MSNRITYRAWCETCDWGTNTSRKTAEHAQEVSSLKTFSHGLETGHHRTKHKRVDVDE